MNDCEFLSKLEKEGKIKWYVFGSEGQWEIVGTGLTLDSDSRLIEQGNIISSEEKWYIKTRRFSIVFKWAEFGVPLEEFWNSIDWEWADKEKDRLDEWFSQTPDF